MKFSAALVFAFISLSTADDKLCTKTIGTHIYDLNPLKANDFYTVTSSKADKFLLNICGPLPKSVDSQDINNAALYVRRNDSTSGQVVFEFPVNAGEISVNDESVAFVVGSSVTCSGSQGYTKMILHLLCNKDVGKGTPKYVYDDGCTYAFFWMTSYACPTNVNTGMSGVSVFFMLLFLSVLGYFCGGILYNRYQGRVGIEQIPNLSFWQKLLSPLASLTGRYHRYRGQNSEGTMLDPEMLDEDNQ